MTGDEAFIPSDMLQSQDSLEAWIALTSHRHLLEIGRQMGKLLRTHSRIHMLVDIMDSEEWEEFHSEVMEDIHNLEAWAERGKRAIWS